MRLTPNGSGIYAQGYADGLARALDIVRSEPELPIRNWREALIAFPLVWFMSLLMPIRSQRAAVRATKWTIAKRIESIKSVEVEVTKR